MKSYENFLKIPKVQEAIKKRVTNEIVIDRTSLDFSKEEDLKKIANAINTF